MNQFKKLIPRKLRRKLRPIAKAVVGTAYGVVQIVNATVPDYSDEAKLAVGVLVTVLTAVGIYRAENRSA